MVNDPQPSKTLPAKYLTDAAIFRREMDGFAVLFHHASFGTVGLSTLQSRAFAGQIGDGHHGGSGLRELGVRCHGRCQVVADWLSDAGQDEIAALSS